MKRFRWILAAAGATASLAACAQAPQPPRATQPTASADRHAEHAKSTTTATTTTASPATARTNAALPKVIVHRSPSCGCCGGWVEHLQRHGFAVEVRMSDDLEPVKKRLGVPAGKGSCHTAEVGGLIVEGHVPAADIQRLLAEPGDARGLVLPGMPLGSPGMESPDGRVQRYTVEKVNADGSTSPFATHGG